jgi:hypothetical protein
MSGGVLSGAFAPPPLWICPSEGQIGCLRSRSGVGLVALGAVELQDGVHADLPDPAPHVHHGLLLADILDVLAAAQLALDLDVRSLHEGGCPLAELAPGNAAMPFGAADVLAGGLVLLAKGVG